MSAKTLAVLVGGGPAPGINAVIAAATIEARNRGLRVLGCHDGYKWLMQGDLGHAEELDVATLSRIHFDGGSILRTSRANPAESAGTLQNVADSLQRLGVSCLVTIGGDDTASGAAAVARKLQGGLAVAHVPKTIDNDLPLPAGTPTFGFTTAVELAVGGAHARHRAAHGLDGGHLARGDGLGQVTRAGSATGCGGWRSRRVPAEATTRRSCLGVLGRGEVGCGDPN